MSAARLAEVPLSNALVLSLPDAFRRAPNLVWLNAGLRFESIQRKVLHGAAGLQGDIAELLDPAFLLAHITKVVRRAAFLLAHVTMGARRVAFLLAHVAKGVRRAASLARMHAGLRYGCFTAHILQHLHRAAADLRRAMSRAFDFLLQELSDAFPVDEMDYGPETVDRRVRQISNGIKQIFKLFQGKEASAQRGRMFSSHRWDVPPRPGTVRFRSSRFVQ